jgi:5'-nucleotidase / UDP-sugar diphosphatase
VSPTSSPLRSPALSPLAAAVAVAVGLGALAGCENGASAPTGAAASASPSASAATSAPPAVVTILYTADEHGWLLPGVEKGATLSGAPTLLGAWIADEKHCTGLPGTAKPCTNPTTIALSGGDSFNGPAVSTLFLGESMAEAMGKMGYEAGVLGNHELDFGHLQFVKNKKLSGMKYLGANVAVKDPERSDLALPPFALIERQGAKIAVIGLASEMTASRSMADRFHGIEFQPVEQALSKAVPDAWTAGADAVVVIAHECPDKLSPVFAKHADWKVSFVGGANCHKSLEDRGAGTVMIAPSGRMQQYARVALTIDRSRPARERVVSVAAKAVDVAGQPDQALQAFVDGWKQKVDAALGQEIGFTVAGLDQKTDAGRWVTEAWRSELGVDVAIVNAKGIAQSLPQGPITKASVYSMMPYDNSLLVVSITGADLLKSLENPEAVAAGAAKSGKSFTVGGKPIDPAARYKVATVEYLYFGGDGFTFDKQDPEPKETGMDWRTPVIEWTQKQGTSKADPVEKKLR